MRLNLVALSAGLLVSFSVQAQESYKVEPIDTPAPSTVPSAFAEALEPKGYKILDAEGKPFVEIWLRKEIPATGKPAGPKGPIQFPILADGEAIGVLQFATEGHDYRDQPIAKGTYTMRYGLQPVNGDHLGVSPFRDYTLLLPVSKDKELKPPGRKALQEKSAEAAGTSHPAVFLLIAPPASAAKSAPKMIQDMEKNLWSVVVPLNLKPKGEDSTVVLPVQIVVVGAAAA
jgi:hypothetical protein